MVMSMERAMNTFVRCGQLFTGAWSDRVGRKPLIVAGMLLQGAALALMAVSDGFKLWAVGAVLMSMVLAHLPPLRRAGGRRRGCRA